MTNLGKPTFPAAAIRAGISRGLIETRQSLTETTSLVGHIVPVVAFVVVLYMIREKFAPGTGFSLATLALPGLMGMSIVFGGVSGPTTTLVADREDGTLLRAKAMPHGMLGYLIGKIVMFALTTMLGFIAVILPGLIIVEDLVLGLRGWLLLGLTFVVGMVATVPIGFALGSVMKSTVQAMLVPILCALLVVPSGIFYPISSLPLSLQWLGQLFPFYWMGLGARSALLPAEMVSIEIDQSWRTAQMFAVLGIWSAVGLFTAPIFMRRMARKQSGSAVAKIRERYLAQGY